MTFTIVQNDTAPPISSQLADGDVPVNLDNASNVRFHMENKYKEVVVDDDLTGRVNIVNSKMGKVEYTWKSDDTTQSGRYKAEWQVLYDDGRVETFPSAGKVGVEITGEIE